MHLPTLTALAQWAGIVMPTLYAGVTFQYSLTLSLLANTSPHPDAALLATQWLAIYQQGPRWVPPLLWPGILANLYLVFFHPASSPPPYQPTAAAAAAATTNICTMATVLYLLAALLAFSPLPYTFLHLEPGINGACKVRVQRLLREDGFHMPGSGSGSGGGGGGGGFGATVRRHTASAAARRRGEEVDMAGLVREWAWWNHPRWVVGVVAGAVSFTAGRVG